MPCAGQYPAANLQASTGSSVRRYAMFAPVAQRRLQRLALAIQTVGAATAGFVVGYLYGKGLDPTSKPQQPSESHGWFGSPHGGSQEVWTHSPDGNSISLRIEGEDLPPTPPLSDPELARWEPGQPSAPMPAMPRHTGILFTPPETWERVPEEEMTEGRVYGNMQPMPKPGTGRILVYPHTDGEEHMLSAHWEGEHVDERTPMRGTTVEGYAPAVLMWAHHMPTSETFFIVDEGATWLPLDKALYDKLMKDL